MELQKVSGHGYQIMVLHDKCGSTNEDYYLADCLHALVKEGYHVTLCSTKVDKYSVLNYTHCTIENLEQYLVFRIIPNSVFGCLKSFCKKLQVLSSTLLSIGKRKPHFILSDGDPFCLFIAKYLLKCKTILLPNVYEMLVTKRMNGQTICRPTWFSNQLMKYVDELIIQTPDFQYFFEDTFSDIQIPTTVAFPCYRNKGSRQKEPFNLRNLVPDLPMSYHLFVAVVDFNDDSNVVMLLNAMDYLNRFYDPNFVIHVHLVITGSVHRKPCSMKYFADLLSYSKGKIFESHITFIWETTIVEQMYLISCCTAVLYPTMHGVHPGSIFMTMAIGKPLVATKSPLAVNIIESGQNGFLVEALPSVFAKMIRYLCEEPAKCKYLSFNAKVDFINKFDFKIFASKICSVFKQYH